MTAHISWDYYTLIKVPHIVLDTYMPITDIYAAIRYSKTPDEIQLNQFSDLITMARIGNPKFRYPRVIPGHEP